MEIILHSDSLIMGGAERLALVYSRILSSNNNHVELIINEDNGKDENVLLEEIPQNVDYKFMSSENLMQKINKYRKLKRKNIIYRILYSLSLKKRRSEVKRGIFKVLDDSNHDILIDFYCKIPLEFTDERTITWLHMTLGAIKDKKKKWYEEKFEKTGKIVVISEAMKEEFISMFPRFKDKVVRIYNPFSFEHILKKSSDMDGLSNTEKELIEESFILSCCRLDEKQKDVNTLIKAYGKLKMENKIEEKLYIIGDGPDREKLESFARENGVEKEVVFLGLQNNPYVWMKKSNLFVHSSKKEGFGMVLVEAMILEKMIVSTDCPVGPSEILEGGKDGYLTPVGDINEMKNNMYAALSDNVLNFEKLDYSKKRVEEFSLEKIKLEINELINDVLNAANKNS